MFDFIFAGANLPFSVSIALMIVITMLEAVSTLLGAGISGFIDSFMPDLDVDLDIDTPDIDSAGVFTKALGWLGVGKVPALMLFIVFLTSFGLVGLCLQSVVLSMFGRLLPASVATVPAFVIALPLVKTFGRILAKVMPQDETYAVSEKSFIGKVATIILGKAAINSPASAKLQDHHGTTHYIMVEPDEKDTEFNQGDSVILVSMHGATFKAIHNTKSVLTD